MRRLDKKSRHLVRVIECQPDDDDDDDDDDDKDGMSGTVELSLNNI